MFHFPAFGNGRIPVIDRSGLYAADFERIFEEHIKPFELRYEEAKSAATRLWRDYSAKSNRLDLLPLESAEYRLLDKECDTAKAEYDRAHALADLLYQEWQQSIIADINRMQEGKP